MSVVPQALSFLRSNRFLTILGVLIYGLSLLLLAQLINQKDFLPLIGLFSVCTLCFGLLYWQRKTIPLSWLIGICILLRAINLWHIPNLSDDVFRFIWDGQLWLNGINPFALKPIVLAQSQNWPEGLSQALFNQLNSPEYFTIYPPVSQGIFTLAAWLGGPDWWPQVLCMKLIVFAFELGNLYLIFRLLRVFKLPGTNLLLYGLHPLPIIELTGNLHFEGIMLFFALLGFKLLYQSRILASALFFTLGIATKLIPLIYFPFLIKRLGIKKSLLFFWVVGLLSLLLFLPLFSALYLGNFSDSLDLYFRNFEFNASIYFILRWLCFHLVGYNLIHILGPAIGVATLFAICTVAFREKGFTWGKFPSMALFASTLYLFLATTIHPWYVVLPLGWAIFTRYRFVVLWALLASLSYSRYGLSEGAYYALVGLEYAAVFIYLFWEIRSNKQSIKMTEC